MPGQNRRTFLKISGGVLGGIAVGSMVTAAERSDRFVVDTSGLSGGDLKRAGLTVIHDLDQVDLAVVEGKESDLESVTTDYGADTLYQLDLPDANDDAPTEDATDEPYYWFQWDKQAQDIPAVHEITRGEGTRVSVIDSGVAAEHPDLQHAVNLDLSRNFARDDLGVGFPYAGGHGTHVSGIIASSDTNDVGVVGSAPGAEIVDLRVFSPDYDGAYFGDILAAMVYSAQIGSDAANLSLGAYPVSRKGLGEFYGGVLNRVMTWVTGEGTLLVIAAGNDAADLQHDGGGVTYVDVDDDGEKERVVHAAFISLPNEGARAVSVSATGPIGYGWDATSVGDEEEPAYAPAIYTNYGTNAITVGAPGGNYSIAGLEEYYDDDDFAPTWYFDLVFNTYAEMTSGNGGDNGNGNGNGNGGGKQSTGKNDDGTSADYFYAWLAGTSMAAPQVAAAAALVKSVDASLNPGQVESILKQTASVPSEYDKTFYGAGFVDPLGAVEKARK